MLSSIKIAVCDVFEAKEIARKLVENRLAASSHIIPIDSVYRWEDGIIKNKEYIIEVLTISGLFDEINKCICDISSYKLTEVVEISNIVTSKEVKDWIMESVKKK